MINTSLQTCCCSFPGSRKLLNPLLTPIDACQNSGTQLSSLCLAKPLKCTEHTLHTGIIACHT